MQRFDTRWAKFNPKRTGNLKPEALPDIGEIGLFEAVWMIEEGENEYAGQWAMASNASESQTYRFHFVWCPEEDLEDVPLYASQPTKLDLANRSALTKTDRIYPESKVNEYRSYPHSPTLFKARNRPQVTHLPIGEATSELLMATAEVVLL